MGRLSGNKMLNSINESSNKSLGKSKKLLHNAGVARAMAVVLLCGSTHFAFANDVDADNVTNPKQGVTVTPSELDVNSAQSSTAKPVSTSHWTLGSTLGEANSDLTKSEAELSTSGVIASQFNVEDSRVGWKFNVGFDVTSNFAIKAGYMDLNEASNDTNSAIADPSILGYQSNKSLSNTAEGFSLGSVYRYNVTDALGFTGSVGVFNWESNLDGQSFNGNVQGVSDQTGGTDIYFGLGGGYQLTNDVSLSIEWEHYKLNDENTDMLSIGVNYHFK